AADRTPPWQPPSTTSRPASRTPRTPPPGLRCGSGPAQPSPLAALAAAVTAYRRRITRPLDQRTLIGMAGSAPVAGRPLPSTRPAGEIRRDVRVVIAAGCVSPG